VGAAEFFVAQPARCDFPLVLLAGARGGAGEGSKKVSEIT